ncbi:glycoside hydrolase family 66 protein [Bacillus tianshenii]|nr:glycoside hydrolase family 66 protein [Bacillus tianshenii]
MVNSWKILLLTSLLLFFLTACVNSSEGKQQNELIQSLQTDKSHYPPGSKVTFTAKFKGSSYGKMEVTYKHLDKTIETKSIYIDDKTYQWTWTPPKENGKGYLAMITYETNDSSDKKTIAVDVSKDWTQFPRYGFLSDFSPKSKAEIDSILDELNRYHLNGIQFNNWAYKHHQPLKGTAKKPDKQWKNIANQNVALKTIKTSIQSAQLRNMNTMANNLLYGAESQAKKQGIQIRWRLYSNPERTAYASHNSPDDWRSDLYVLNPFHEGWQDYIIENQKQAMDTLGFDGWHVDQLGDKSPVYNFAATKISLEPSYEPFLNKAKEQINNDLVMNAVDQYGQEYISKTPVDFLYSEVQDPNSNYSKLKQIIDENNELTYHQKNTVLAAYMNSNLSNRKGSFNTPGVLLTNSVIFASGGAHLELGEHMLSKEYFPHNKLKMDKQLKESLINYYDFLTAYENLLRDRMKASELKLVNKSTTKLSQKPTKGKVWVFSKGKENKKVLHLLNFTNVKHMNWQDTNGTQTEPKAQRNLPVSLKESLDVNKIWYASPDFNGGAPASLSFKQKNNKLTFKVPRLKYWDMVVIEYK